MEEAVDTLVKKVNNKSIWDVVEFAIAIWSRKYPVESSRFYRSQGNHKQNRLNKFGSTKAMQLRELVNLPWEINYLLEKLARDRIEEYGKKKFWREFAKRYPGFATAEKI